jgi:cytochrome b pre-mRNA-processing protein 3
MPIMSLFRRRQPHADAARRLFDAIVAQSRRAEFYQHFGVPDTLDGRFDLMVLHVFMVIERLQGEAAAGDLPQVVVDRMFTILDLNLREMGVQDVGIGKRIKVMAEGFNGRINAYRTALADDDGGSLRQALHRNVFGAADIAGDQLANLEAYVRTAVAALRALPVRRLVEGYMAFPDPVPQREAP